MEFVAHPKTMRWFRDIVITEKIDGTNAAVIIEPYNAEEHTDNPHVITHIVISGQLYVIGAQSRKRLITPADDNYGFAAWVEENAVELVRTLGVGRHMGEWWGQGIQRGYGLDEKRFSLFNTGKWKDADLSAVPRLHVVPVLYEGVNNEIEIFNAAESLQFYGSLAAPGFPSPEGVCIFHVTSNKIFKYTPHCKDDGHKG